jgi:hypothetical protein
VGRADTHEEDRKVSRRGSVVCRGRGPGVRAKLDGKVGFHSGSRLKGRSVRFRVPLTRDFEAIAIHLECSRTRRL